MIYLRIERNLSRQKWPMQEEHTKRSTGEEKIVFLESS